MQLCPQPCSLACSQASAPHARPHPAPACLLHAARRRLKALPEGLSKLSGLQQLSLFAAFSHTPRNEDAPAVGVLAALVLAAGEALHLQAEDVVMALVRLRRRRLQQAAARAAALSEPL